ncbi:hypothetical protein [Calothrix sp. NIES-2098]|uniref:hypothetical protein n=1 Tax=Calothrix sp. NIES-2098 TaxID=1954171 RepID=UPI000B60DE85|nr:hypothetical protein NIES2098_00670 [Calothrix sp. NIES-2098]
MSVWLSIALGSYILGAIIQWLQLSDKLQELEEYTNFPIIWAANLVSKCGCFLKALIWPYSLIVDNES